MSPTLPPWLTGWPRGMRAQVHTLEYYRALAREHARQHRLAVYSYQNDPELFRIREWNGRIDLAIGRDPVDSFEVDYYRRQQHVEHSPEATAAARGLPWSAARVWLCGTAVLVLIIVLVRVVEKCINLKLKKLRPNLREWSAANVHATSREVAADNGTVIIPELENVEPLPTDLSDTMSLDLPPPYAVCAASPVAQEPTSSFMHSKTVFNLFDEEPPPPYSDTYVEFSNKDGIPTVLIFSYRRTPLVNRREIVDSGVVAVGDEVTTTEQNTENTNTEIANEAARNAESDDLVEMYRRDVYDSVGNTRRNSIDPAVEVDENERTLKDSVVIV